MDSDYVKRMKKEFWKATIPAALAGGAMGFLSNYFISPMPETIMENAMNNGISGFMAGLMGVLTYFFGLKRRVEKENKNKGGTKI